MHFFCEWFAAFTRERSQPACKPSARGGGSIWIPFKVKLLDCLGSLHCFRLVFASRGKSRRLANRPHAEEEAPGFPSHVMLCHAGL